MCLYPRLIKNRKYMPNKKNKGIVPTMNDERVMYVPVGCGKCIECLKQKARNWQIRMLEEIKVSTNGKFVTLSFTNDAVLKLADKVIIKNDNQIYENEIAKTGLRYFLESWRKEYGKSVKHWCVTGLGQNNSERIHIHGIIFTDNVEAIKKHWHHGNIYRRICIT